ncbi:MAG: endopeptidase La [Planctomycetota bacterium]|nr:endopeptidase La [Planctomycetota bacterium]
MTRADDEKGALAPQTTAAVPTAARVEVPPESAAETPAAEVETLLIVPVRNMVLFPGVVLPVVVGRPRAVETIQEAVRTQKPIGVLLQRDEKVDEPGRADLYEVGTVAEIVRFLTAPDGRHHAICQGQQRFRLLALESGPKGLVGRIERLVEPESSGLDVQARFVALKTQAKEVLELSPGAPEDLSTALQGIQSPSLLTDMVATFLDIPVQEKQAILEVVDVGARMNEVGTKLGHLAQVLQLSQKIREETKGTLEKAQKDYFLREQLKQIQKELLGGEEERSELEHLKEALTKAALPADAKKEVDKEVRRLERMNESGPEYSMLRTYLDIVAELPWAKVTEDSLDVARAKKILDEDHHGLQKVKRHILEYLAVRKLKPDGRRPNLCLVGPPGVGKTSLGQSIARAMGRKFVRVSLGGVHDEAEIRGHRRTYIGAMPGLVLNSLRKAGTRNPVFMLDEIDKLGRGFQGDPASALLEVLDPEQNRAFRDNYLGTPFDLSQVLFIATANVLDQIPGPLRDRFEVVELPGYTREEKLEIARRYLVPRQLEHNGLDAKRCAIDDAVVVRVLEGWTREAGVRGLERQIASLVRWAAARIASGEARKVRIKKGDVETILGASRFQDETKSRVALPGVATGLAWTPHGGEILFVEATSMPGKGQLVLTGQLGDVMRESALAAMSLVKSRMRSMELDPRFFESHDLHVHLPAGAIQKDGPSAGVALYVALVSLLTGRNTRADVAMTGEISLRGLVLPIGGVKEKVLGARAAGIKTVLLPKRNEPDLADVPASARAEMRFVLLENVDQALAEALEPIVAPTVPGRAPRKAAARKRPSAARTKRSAPPARRPKKGRAPDA